MWYARQKKERKFHDVTRISVKERHLLEENNYMAYKNVDGIRLPQDTDQWRASKTK